MSLKKYLTYQEIEEATKKLAKNIAKRGFNSEKTLIVGIARGGLMLAQYMAYIFDIRNVVCIESERYDNEETNAVIEIRNIYAIDYDNFDTIILVDDIYDEGITLDTIITILYETAFQFRGRDIEIIPGVLLTQAKKKVLKKKKIEWGIKVKKIKGKKPWVVFPWDNIQDRVLIPDREEDLN
jgi:hypoxanthine phosphoribosyltransferase